VGNEGFRGNPLGLAISIRFIDGERRKCSGGYRYRRYESVSALRKGLNESRIFGRVRESLAYLLYRNCESALKIDSRIRAPNLRLQFAVGHDLAGLRKQSSQHFKGLILQFHPVAGLPDLTALEIHFK